MIVTKGKKGWDFMGDYKTELSVKPAAAPSPAEAKPVEPAPAAPAAAPAVAAPAVEAKAEEAPKVEL